MTEADAVSLHGLPCDPFAERMVLGLILGDPTHFPLMQGTLSPGDFATQANQQIFARMADLYERGESITHGSLANELNRKQQLASAGGLSYIVDIDTGVPHFATGADSYARTVKDKSILRRGAILAQHLANELCTPGADVSSINRAQQILNQLSADGDSRGQLKSISELIESHPTGVNGLLQPHKSGFTVKTPWGSVNSLITGFRPGQLVIVAARPGVGKSAAAGQIAVEAAQHGESVAFFSLEMSADEVLLRMICSRADVSLHDLRRGHMTSGERQRLLQATRLLSELPLSIDDRTGCTPAAIHAAVRKHKSKHGVRLVIVDYLQLMASGGRQDRRVEEVAYISRTLKLAARELEVPFLVCAQLNRAPATENRRPQLHDLRECGAIESDADIVCFLHQQEMATQKANASTATTGDAEWIIAKNRNGPRGKLALHFNARLVRFEERCTDEQ